MLVSIRYIAVLGFQRGDYSITATPLGSFQSAISRYLVSNPDWRYSLETRKVMFQSAISRYLVSNRGRINVRVSLGTLFQSAISRYLVSNILTKQDILLRVKFQSAISRYLVSNPTSKTPPLTSGGGNGLHTPRRIDHIPTFASLN